MRLRYGGQGKERFSRARTQAILYRLAMIHTGVTSPLAVFDAWDQDYWEDDHPDYVFETLHMIYVKRYVVPFGDAVGQSILLKLTRSFRWRRWALNGAAVAAVPLLVGIYGAYIGSAAALGMLLVIRLLQKVNSRAGATLAQDLLDKRSSVRETRAVRRAVRGSFDSIPARSLTYPCWQVLICDALGKVKRRPLDDGAREVLLSLADEFDGSVGDLHQTAVYLVR